DAPDDDVRSADRKKQLAAVARQDDPVVLYEDRPQASLSHAVSSNVARHTMERLLWMLENISDLKSKENSDLMNSLRTMRDRLHQDEQKRIADAKEHRAAISRAAMGLPPAKDNGSMQTQTRKTWRASSRSPMPS